MENCCVGLADDLVGALCERPRAIEDRPFFSECGGRVKTLPYGVFCEALGGGRVKTLPYDVFCEALGGGGRFKTLPYGVFCEALGGGGSKRPPYGGNGFFVALLLRMTRKLDSWRTERSYI